MADEEKTFCCPFRDCERAIIGFRQNYLLTAHIRTHTDERPYKCKFSGCSKLFRRQENLTYHLRSHTGEKRYKCRVCGEAKIYPSDRAKHEKRVHSSLKRYKCGIDICPKDYTEPSSLRRHQWRKHKDYMEGRKTNKTPAVVVPADTTTTMQFDIPSPVQSELWCDTNMIQQFRDTSVFGEELKSATFTNAVSDEDYVLLCL